jgi:hypothetical protein
MKLVDVTHCDNIHLEYNLMDQLVNNISIDVYLVLLQLVCQFGLPNLLTFVIFKIICTQRSIFLTQKLINQI